MKKRILILLMLFMSIGIYAGNMEKKGDIVIVTDEFGKQVIVDPMNPNIVFYKSSMFDEIYINYNGVVIFIYKNGISIEEVYEFLYNGEGKFDNSVIKIAFKKS